MPCRNNILRTMRLLFKFFALIAAALAILAGPVRAADIAAQKYPDVLSAKISSRGTDTFDFDVTISSPYDTPQRYADAFHVMDKNGAIYGERTLWHDHADEQPFTRVFKREDFARSERGNRAGPG